MASPPITEASEVRRRGRQRLIGAVALVAILVVFVPMVLDSEPRPQRPDSALAIPPKANAPPLPSPPPAGKVKGAAEPAKAAEPAPAVPAKAAEEPSQVAAVEPSKASPAAKAPAAEPRKAAATQPAKPAPKLEGFAVQVGAFRDEAKLAQARHKLATAGVAHYTERLDTPTGPLTRLRAGPFATREAAEGALAALKRVALDGKVVTLP